MAWNATHHHGVIDPQVIVAALGAAAFLYARFKVTPVADPKDGNGQPLVAAVTAAMLAGAPPYRTSTGNVTVVPAGVPPAMPPEPPLPRPQKTLQPPAAPE